MIWLHYKPETKALPASALVNGNKIAVCAGVDVSLTLENNHGVVFTERAQRSRSINSKYR